MTILTTIRPEAFIIPVDQNRGRGRPPKPKGHALDRDPPIGGIENGEVDNMEVDDNEVAADRYEGEVGDGDHYEAEVLDGDDDDEEEVLAGDEKEVVDGDDDEEKEVDKMDVDVVDNAKKMDANPITEQTTTSKNIRSILRPRKSRHYV